MKKTIAIVLSLILCVAMLTGCGGAKDDKTITVAASPTPHAEILAVKEGNENSEKIQALKKALMSDAVKTFINDTYSGAVVPIF